MPYFSAVLIFLYKRDSNERDIQTRIKVNNRPVCMYNVHQNVDFINTNLKLIGILWGFWHLKVVGQC